MMAEPGQRTRVHHRVLRPGDHAEANGMLFTVTAGFESDAAADGTQMLSIAKNEWRLRVDAEHQMAKLFYEILDEINLYKQGLATPGEAPRKVALRAFDLAYVLDRIAACPLYSADVPRIVCNGTDGKVSLAGGSVRYADLRD
jgi:hypothetical protein